MFPPFAHVYGANSASASSQHIHSSFTAGPASQRPSTDSANAVRISLTSNTSTDKRTFTLRPGETTIIGRSSRSDFKNLQEAPDNALFDCPVVSRTHAELRTCPWEPTHKQITITDRSSLHGTTVNGMKLAPGSEFVLKSGDVIKLGDRVTRGDDTHDGVSLTFAHIDPPAEFTQSFPTGSRFQVPSDDEEDVSDMESDHESIHSLQEGPSSSANTTPEQHKRKLGSQQQPINIEAMPKTVINLDLDDDDDLIIMPAASNPLPTIRPRVVPDTYDDVIVPESVGGQEPSSVFLDAEYAQSDEESDAESVRLHNTGLSQILNNRTHVPSSESDEESLVDESEDEEMDCPATQDCDLFSESGGSDMTNDAISEQREHFLTNRQVSPELGDSEPPLRSNYAAPTVSESFPPAPKPRYDPVRNSQPPETTPQTTANMTSPSWPLRWDSVPTANPPADMFPNTRWDMSPIIGFGENSADFRQVYPPQIFQSMPSNSSVGFLMPADSSYPAITTGKEISSQPSLSQLLNAVTPEPPATKSKISITDIVDEPSQDSPSVPAAPSTETLAAPVTVPAAVASVPSPVGKRKAAEVEADDTTARAEPSPKKSKPTVVETVPTSLRTKSARKTKRRSLTRRVASSAVHLATGAVMGMGATIMFLNSDKAQQLIDWLA